MDKSEKETGGLAGFGGKAPDPFEVRGELKVRDSATVLCIRRRQRLEEEDVGKQLAEKGAQDSKRTKSFGESFTEKYHASGLPQNAWLSKYTSDRTMHFESEWEILLGQSEVVNWLKSTRDKVVTMRYPGEFKLAGGHVDDGETQLEAAKRELAEEFLRPAETQVPPEDIFLRPFAVKQTRPIRSKSNLMYNFIALAEENPWLQNLDVEEINRALHQRREDFQAFLKLPDSPYFSSYDLHQKELVSPEVYQLQWVPLEQAFENCLTSVLEDVYVNEWQRKEFYRVGRTRRDPLVMTGAVLVELEMFTCLPSLVEYCESVDLEQLRKEEQWLFSGMTNGQVVQAFQDRLGNKEERNPSFKSLEYIHTQREMLKEKRRRKSHMKPSGL